MKRWGYVKGEVRYKDIAEKVYLLTDARKRMAEIGMTAPKVTGLDAATVGAEFTAVLRRDLDETGVIATLQERLPAEGAALAAWKEAGAQWLLSVRINRVASGDLQLDASVLDTSAEKGVFTRTYNVNTH
jgi:hypothetical protein